MQLEIQVVGNTKFPRFVIARSDGQVFDGRGWNTDRSKAILYNESMAVALQYNALQDTMCKDWPIQEFTVPLNIRVRSAQPFSQAELEEFLEKAVAILIDQDKGTGPTPYSMVQLDVTWREIQESPCCQGPEAVTEPALVPRVISD